MICQTGFLAHIPKSLSNWEHTIRHSDILNQPPPNPPGASTYQPDEPEVGLGL